jgi:hypothetical protein
MKNFIIIVIGSLLLTCCKQNVNTNDFAKSTITYLYTDSLEKIQSEMEEEIIEQHVKEDILTIEYLAFYPFGKYFSLEDFLRCFPSNSTVSEEISGIRGAAAYAIKYKDSYIRFFLVEIFREYKKIEIGTTEIVDKGIKLKNDIEIGISKSLFFQRLSVQKPSNFDHIRAVIIQSYSSWFLFSFDEKNQLEKIEFFPSYSTGTSHNHIVQMN